MALIVNVMDKDSSTTSDLIGGFSINLRKYNYNTTYEVQQALDDDAGKLYFRMNLQEAASVVLEEVSHLRSRTTLNYLRQKIADKYITWNLTGDMNDVGEVLVIAYRATSIAQPRQEEKLVALCCVELAPKVLWREGEPRTADPTWNVVFRMKVSDVHAILQITVLSGVKNQEFLGMAAFPLIAAEPRRKQWYPLQNAKLSKPTGGYILLEIDLIYHPLKAAIQSFKPKAPCPPALDDSELSRHSLTRNMARAKALFVRYKEITAFIRGCYLWESIPRTITSLLLFVWLCLKLEAYMVPWLLVIVFFTDLLVFNIWYKDKPEPLDIEESEDESSLKMRLVKLQEAAATMQNAIGKVASYGERVRNLFAFVDPFVSKLFIVVFIVAGFLAYWVSPRYWILFWGLRKYYKGLKGAKFQSRGFSIKHLLNRTPDSYERFHYTAPLPDAEKAPRTVFKIPSMFSLQGLKFF